jgi:hypothetical protein
MAVLRFYLCFAGASRIERGASTRPIQPAIDTNAGAHCGVRISAKKSGRKQYNL